ncbi:MAG: hypothetical protein M5T61_10390 [Acidimicrobiia bacterium]|nr:hypothetical protein [Acidimicrobiia bacterium]
MTTPEYDVVAVLRRGIADALAPLTLGEQGGQVHPYRLSSPTAPCMFVTLGDPSVSYDEAGNRGVDLYRLRIVAYAGAVDDEPSQRILDRWIAPSGAASVKGLCETDPTLGGVALDLRVTQVSDYQVATREGAGAVLAVVFDVEVYARGVSQ